MKLLTLNTHSLQEPDGPQKLEQFTQAVRELRPDLIALQEVNQPLTAPRVPLPGGFVPAPGHSIPLRKGNYAWQVVLRLQEAGLPCSWTWLPIKVGYGRYDEGLALISLGAPISSTQVLLVSRKDRYWDWRTRKALAVRLDGRSDWFVSVHMGWWGDSDPFPAQWERLEAGLAELRRQGPVWLLGDFNAPSHVRGESYDRITASGWQDTYPLAAQRDSGITVEGVIDGWRDKLAGEIPDGMRIDYIWCSRPAKIARSQVVFNGKNRPVVSDHYGILVETEED